MQKRTITPPPVYRPVTPPPVMHALAENKVAETDNSDESRTLAPVGLHLLTGMLCFGFGLALGRPDLLSIEHAASVSEPATAPDARQQPVTTVAVSAPPALDNPQALQPATEPPEEPSEKEILAEEIATHVVVDSMLHDLRRIAEGQSDALPQHRVSGRSASKAVERLMDSAPTPPRVVDVSTETQRPAASSQKDVAAVVLASPSKLPHNAITSSMVSIPVPEASLSVIKGTENTLACQNLKSLDTALKWAPSPAKAAELAKAEEKLVFMIHVSGNFEIPEFT